MSKKILWVHAKFGFFGGAEQFIFSSAEGLKGDYTSSMLYFQKCPRTFETFHAPFIRAHQIDFDQDNEEIFRLAKEAIAFEKPDVIYVHKCLSVKMMQALLESKIPIVRMFHDHEVYCLRGSKTFPFSRKICTSKAPCCCLFPGFAFLKREWPYLRWPQFFKHRRLTRLDKQCQLFLTPSNYLANELKQQGYDPTKIAVLHPTPATEPDPNFTSSFSDENILLFIGQLVRGKGLDCLLKALKQVRSPYQLYVCGSGPEEIPCKILAHELGISHLIHFKGWVPNHKLENYYKDATAGVVPSVWGDPFPLVGAEYMLRGLPVVAFNSGGIGEWLNDDKTGYLIPWMDINGMANGIEKLLTDKTLARKFGEEGRKVATQKFTMATSLEETRKFLNELTSC